MLTSILHRVSGVALYVGGLVLAGWAIALASGPDAFETYRGIIGSIPGKVVLFAFIAAAFYHLAKGIQHLVWDAGQGFSLPVANAVAIGTIAFAAAATIAVWVIAAMMGAL